MQPSDGHGHSSDPWLTPVFSFQQCPLYSAGGRRGTIYGVCLRSLLLLNWFRVSRDFGCLVRQGLSRKFWCKVVRPGQSVSGDTAVFVDCGAYLEMPSVNLFLAPHSYHNRQLLRAISRLNINRDLQAAMPHCYVGLYVVIWVSCRYVFSDLLCLMLLCVFCSNMSRVVYGWYLYRVAIVIFFVYRFILWFVWKNLIWCVLLFCLSVCFIIVYTRVLCCLCVCVTCYQVSCVVIFYVFCVMCLYHCHASGSVGINRGLVW